MIEQENGTARVRPAVVFTFRQAGLPSPATVLAQVLDVLGAADPSALSDAFEAACAQGPAGGKRPAERSLTELGPTPDDLTA